jgi:hypothetical protein
VSAEQRLRHLVDEIEPADQVGLDVFGVGEHHRPDFAVSAPAVDPRPRALPRADERRRPAAARRSSSSAPNAPAVRAEVARRRHG